MYIYMYIYTYMYTYVYMYIYICIYSPLHLKCRSFILKSQLMIYCSSPGLFYRDPLKRDQGN